ncbi:MAG: hypothetical protein IPL96_10000 [Holophagaceae bacterium]|nr:hypothetical protein [Holophagaceae bacterium]
MSIQASFTRAFSSMRAQLRTSHPAVRDVTFEIPNHPGSTLRVQVGVVLKGYRPGDPKAPTVAIEEIVQACLREEGLPEATEIFYASPEDLDGVTAHRHFFGKVTS